MVNPIITTTEDIGTVGVCVELTGNGYQLSSNLTVTLTDIGTPNTACMLLPISLNFLINLSFLYSWF